MAVLYNENDPFAAEWLRWLIARGLIAPGDVDERSIVDVRSADLAGYAQCHFFAGIGGWSLALRLAGWPDDRPVWTGSCPCQPLSSAGRHLGDVDERHLWPAFHDLIAECRPPALFGEQVANKDGREWLSGIRADLERLGYAIGCADLSAAGVGAPHIRQRLFWMADAGFERRRLGGPPYDPRNFECGNDADRCDAACGMADAQHDGRRADEPQRQAEGRTTDGRAGQRDIAGRLGIAVREGLEGHAGHVDDRHQSGRLDAQPGRSVAEASSAGVWSRAELVHCTDGKARRIESGSFPLAHGVPARVGRLRAYGNAIVPQLAAQFIAAADEAMRAA